MHVHPFYDVPCRLCKHKSFVTSALTPLLRPWEIFWSSKESLELGPFSLCRDLSSLHGGGDFRLGFPAIGSALAQLSKETVHFRSVLEIAAVPIRHTDFVR